MSAKVGVATADLAVGRSPVRRLSVGLDRHPRIRVALLIGLPLLALVGIYFGSLFTLLVNAFWTRDPLTGHVIREFTLENFADLASPLFVTVTLRTIGMALAVTVTCAILAF